MDLEKAFDRNPREVVRWAMRKLGVDEWLIRTVMALYTEACTVVRTDAGLSESFEVKVGLHQGSVLSPLLWMLFPVRREEVCLPSCCRPSTCLVDQKREDRTPPPTSKGHGSG